METVSVGPRPLPVTGDDAVLLGRLPSVVTVPRTGPLTRALGDTPDARPRTGTPDLRMGAKDDDTRIKGVFKGDQSFPPRTPGLSSSSGTTTQGWRWDTIPDPHGHLSLSEPRGGSSMTVPSDPGQPLLQRQPLRARNESHRVHLRPGPHLKMKKGINLKNITF